MLKKRVANIEEADDEMDGKKVVRTHVYAWRRARVARVTISETAGRCNGFSMTPAPLPDEPRNGDTAVWRGKRSSRKRRKRKPCSDIII